VYLTVEGADVALIREVQMLHTPDAGVKARRFAQELNRLAAAPGTAGPSKTPVAAAQDGEPRPALPSFFPAGSGPAARASAAAGPMAPPLSTAAPSWYPDGHGDVRWFDGYAWTDNVRAKPPKPPAGGQQDERA
jgi:hypothetical protein